MSNPRIAEASLKAGTRFPVNRQDHTQKGPYAKCAFLRLMKKKWPMQSPTGELVNMQGLDGPATAIWWEALRGDVQAAREIFDRIDGKVPQKFLGEGFENKNITIVFNDGKPHNTNTLHGAPLSREVPHESGQI